MREWLNNEFWNNAFSEAEQTYILTVSVNADRNPEYNTNPGKSTKDKVFLLSINEANKYFSSSEERMCIPTECCHAQTTFYNLDGKLTCCWWLRSPGEKPFWAAFVIPSGAVSCSGSWVHTSGLGVNNDYYGVRPAMWITLEPSEESVN